MNKAIEISRFFYLLGLIGIPFITFPYSYTPYTLSKTLFFIFITLLSLIFFLLSKPKDYSLPNRFFIILIIIELIIGLFNFNLFLFPRYSEHFFITFTLFVYLFLTLNIVKTLDLEKVIFFSSFIVVLPSLIVSFTSNERASGTLGQANFLGIYLVLILLILLKNYTRYLLIINKYVLLSYTILVTILFIKAASISAFMALGIGVTVIFSELIRQSKFNIQKIGIGIFALLIIFFLSGQLFISKTIDIYNQIFYPEQTIISDSFIIRTKIWTESLKIVKENPSILLWGYGPNNFSLNFEKIRGDSLIGLSEENFLYDKPHNYFLEIILSYGLIYFFIFGYLTFKVLSYKKDLISLILPILFFIFFNWLDLYLKVIFFTLIITNLSDWKVKSSKIFNIAVLTVSIVSLASFSQLFYRDTAFYFNNQEYIYSYSKRDIVSLKVKDPIVLIYFIQISNENEEKKEIFDYLIKNFPNNQAILFNLNKLF